MVVHAVMLVVFVMVAITGRPPGSGSLAEKKKQRKYAHWLVENLRKLHPHLAALQYSTQLHVYATMYVTYRRLSRRILECGDDNALLNEAGEVKTSIDSIRRLGLALAVLARDLGISPSSRARIAKEADAARFDSIRQAMQTDDAPALPAPEGEKSDESE